ncbi:MAG TPA: sensor histidine kinase, partial [Thermoanaerobaculia bacterium]|nr:sensor histidine kinase [Thermoanaerobaculia bacterium]
LSNAIEHRPADTPVIAALDGRGSEVVLEVRNAADAVPPRDLFAPFEQRPGSEGLGLGLFIVREVMQAHGGSIAASFEGGEFRVRAIWPRNR